MLAGIDSNVDALLASDGEGGRDSHARLVLHCWCAHRHEARGRFLEAQACLHTAIEVFLSLQWELGIAAYASRRRLETRDPQLARELLGVLMGAVERPDLRLLAIAERRLRSAAPHLDWDTFDDVRRLIETPDGPCAAGAAHGPKMITDARRRAPVR